MDVVSRVRSLWTLSLCAGIVVACSATADAQRAKPLARVNETTITLGDVELELLSRNVHAVPNAEQVRKELSTLIDREIVFQFLKAKGVAPDLTAVNAQVQRLNEILTLRGEEPQKVLERLGYTTARLRIRLSYASMWENYFRQAVPEEELRAYFDARREQFDGTQYRASQIFLKLDREADPATVAAASQRLTDWKRQIDAGTISFADAARQWSQAPSGENGGDVGFFPYRGKMPADFSAGAFGQKVGTVGEPFRSAHGMHLVLLTDKRPGQFSLEDVRKEVIDRMQSELHAKIVEQERPKAKIVMLGE